MFLLFDVATQSFILGYVPEPLEVLIFGIGLILLTIGLRWFMRRSETNVESEIEESK